MSEENKRTADQPARSEPARRALLQAAAGMVIASAVDSAVAQDAASKKAAKSGVESR